MVEQMVPLRLFVAGIQVGKGPPEVPPELVASLKAAELTEEERKILFGDPMAPKLTGGVIELIGVAMPDQEKKLSGGRIKTRLYACTGQEPVTGRNEKCPCGIGKKYKLCHRT